MKAAVVVPRIGGKWEVRELPTPEPPCRLLRFERSHINEGEEISAAGEEEEEVRLNKYNPYYGNIMSIKIPYLRKKIPSTLLVLSAIALLLLASSPLLLVLSPFTMSVFAQTETDAGDDDDDAAPTMASGATNDNTAAAAATANANAIATGNNNMTTGARFLFIQSAQSGSVSEVNATTFTLVLSNVSDKTILFSDRPDRIVGSANTTDFIGNWSIGTNNFAVDPPNAVLILDDEVEQRQDFAVIELFSPEYDSKADTLRYDITAENATTTTTATSSSINNLPGEFGQSTLVIDDDRQVKEQTGQGKWFYPTG